jgi:O-antigen ligase
VDAAGEQAGRGGVAFSRVAAAAVPLVLVPALGLVQGGFHPDAWVWSGALAAWAGALAVVLSDEPGALRRAWPWAAAAVGLALWTLASALWSVDTAQSVLEARRTLVYAAVVLALLLLARRGATRLLVLSTHGAVTALLVPALGYYLLAGRHRDVFEGYLLSRPIGYANGAGILAALGILLALSIALEASSPAARAVGAATVPPLALALWLTGSVGSWLALGVGLAVTVLLEPRTRRLLRTLATVAPPAALIVGLGWYSRYAVDTPSPRVGGAVLAAATAGCAAAAALAARRLRGVDGSLSRRARRLVVAAVLCVALGCAAAVATAGATEPRASYWHVAWHDQYRAHPLLGSGAGTFGRYWARSGLVASRGGALDAHSLYLETLAELGPLGLALVAALLLAPLKGAVRRRSAPYLPAAVGAYVAFIVHAGLDWDWELPTVVVAGLCCAASIAAAAVEPSPPLGRTSRGALLLVAAALAACAIAGSRSNTGPTTEKAPQARPSPMLVR